jgi:hypothetical protein
MIRLPIAAASAVTMSNFAKPSGSTIAFPSTSGFTKSTYDIVRKVVSPARSSRGMVEPAAANFLPPSFDSRVST